MNKKTSIKDIDGDELTFEQQSWAGFKISTNHCHRSFQNNRGPLLAIGVLEASGYGNSNAARVLYTLIETIETHPDYETEPVPPATVVPDSLTAVREALAILSAAARIDLPVVAEVARATQALEEYTRRVQLEEDQQALEGEALTLCRTLWDNPDQQWAPMSAKAKTTWLTMARTARNLHGVQA